MALDASVRRRTLIIVRQSRMDTTETPSLLDCVNVDLLQVMLAGYAYMFGMPISCVARTRDGGWEHIDAQGSHTMFCTFCHMVRSREDGDAICRRHYLAAVEKLVSSDRQSLLPPTVGLAFFPSWRPSQSRATASPH